MSSQTNSRLDELLAECVRADEAGRPLDPQSLIAEHPDLADDIRSFFANRRAVERLAAPLRELLPADTPTLGSGANATGENEPGPGTVIRYFGDYEILAEIARGGMGVVYKARQTKLARVVALKMILAGQLATADDVQRFRQEAESAAQLDHPQIVPIYEIGEHEGQHYFSMKLIEGGSLRDQLARMHKQPALAARTLAAAARGMHHAHQRGVLHRDLKPSNILIDRAGEPHVTDFGLAKRVEAASDMTQTGAVLGTPSYMAPEQAAASKQLTTAADVYSLGAILYELLAGKPPFAAETPVETLLAVMSREPEPLRKLRPDVDRDLETICHKCLEKDPSHRYDSAAALAEELERWGRGEPILARPASAFEQAVKWARREPMAAGLAAVIGACVLVLIVGLAVALWRESDRVVAEQLLRGKAQESQESAEERVYFAKILLAHSALEQRQIGQVERALDDTRADFRNWEWRYLQHRINSHLRSLKLGDDPALARFSEDGKHIFYPGDSFAGRVAVDGSGRIIQGGQGTGYGRTQGSPAPNVAVNRRQSLFVAANQREVVLYDLEREHVPKDGSRVTFGNGAVLAEEHVLETGPKDPGFSALMRAVCFSPNEKLVYVSGDKRICCFDVAERKLRWEIPLDSHNSWAIAVSPDGARLALSTEDKTVRVITLADKQEIFRSGPHTNTPDDLVFTADGKRLMSHSSFDNPKLWNLETKEQLLKIPGGWGSVTRLNDDRSLAATGMTEGQVVLWDTASGKIVATLRGHAYWPYVLAFSRDGRRLASGGRDKTVILWDVAERKKLKTIVGHHSAVLALDFSPDGKTLLTGASSREGIKLWEVESPGNPQQIDAHGGLITCWAMFPDGRRVVVGGHWYSDKEEKLGRVEIYDLAAGKIVQTLGPQGIETGGVAVSEDGKVVAIGGSDGSVVLWNPETGRPIRTLREPVPPESQGVGRRDDEAIRKWKYWKIDSLAMSRDGSRVAVGTHDGRIALHDAATGRELWQARRRPPEDWSLGDDDQETDEKGKQVGTGMHIRRLQFTKDGRQLVALAQYGNNLVTIYDTATGSERYVSPALEYHDYGQLALSPDGRWLIFGATNDGGQTKLLDLTDLARPAINVRPANAEPTHLSAGTFSADSRRFALATSEEVIELYELAADPAQPPRRVALLKGHEGTVEDLTFLPDGTRLFSASSDHTVKLWDLQAGIELLSLPMSDDHESRACHLLISNDGTRVVATDGFPQSGAGPFHQLVSWYAPAAK